MKLEHYVPFQLGTIIRIALVKVDTVLKKCAKDNNEWDFNQKAKERFAELRSEDDKAKRQRLGPYSAC